MNTIEVNHLSMLYQYTVANATAANPLFRLITRKKVEKRALYDLHFTVSQGDIVGYVGLNGAGKTTTIKILAGIMKPTDGSVKVLGCDPFERKESFLKEISIIMGSKSQLMWDLPAIDSIIFNKKIYEVPDHVYKKYLDMMAEMLRVGDLLHKQVRRLSLGERMKMELIAALIHAPKMIFMDEPTIGLDILSQENIRKFLKTINSEWGSTILLTSHNIDDISEVCNELLLIDQGRLCYKGTLTEFEKLYGEKTVTLTIADKQKEIMGTIQDEQMSITDIWGNQVSIGIGDHQNLGRIQNLWGRYSKEITDISIKNRELKEIISRVIQGEQNIAAHTDI